MSAPAMIMHLLLERLYRRPLPRIPEAELVMETPAQVQAYADSGRHNGVLRYIGLYLALEALPVIRPGDRVLDLACGPANQLLQMAALNPEAEFVGLDASPAMLAQARAALETAGAANVSLCQGDISRLDGFAAHTVDVVLCTMSLHHLPDTEALARTFGEIDRILTPGGGVFLADFGRLKRRATQRFFAHDRADMQTPAFTRDFLDSLGAAFSLQEIRQASAALRLPLDCHCTALAPFMMIWRSPARAAIDARRRDCLRRSWQALPAGLKRDFDNLARWFAAGGLPLPCRPA